MARNQLIPWSFRGSPSASRLIASTALSTSGRIASTLVSSCLVLSLSGCIKRTLECPPVNGAPATAAASPSGKLPATPGKSVLGPTGLKSFVVQGDADKVVLTTLPVTGQPFTEAVRAEVKKGSGHEWAVQLQAPNAAPLEEGDVLLATFYVRAEKPLEDTGAGQTQFVFELGKEPYDKSITYDVQMGGEWRKIYVAFVSKKKFAAGEAHAIFRLGYDIETIDIGGVTVETYGKAVKVSALPTSPRWTPPVKADANASLEPMDGGPLAFEVDPSKPIGPISPYVYGINSQKADGLGTTVRRMGGNRQTAYNWEINASNAGSDWKHVNDEWPCSVLGYAHCSDPAGQFLDFAADNKRIGADTLATIPMVDYVSADKKQEVSDAEKAPSKRWNRSFPRKTGARAATPDLNDGSVYQDEFVDYLVHKLGRADKGGIKFYSLDNEPALWSSTHPRIHPDKTTYQEMITRSEATAAAITEIDPSAIVLGAVAFGWSEYMTLQDAPDAKQNNAKYETYLDFYLASMKALEGKYHHRLIHDLDVHWYPEARGTKRITDDDNSPKTIEARVQAPRAMWDPTYREKSWIDDAINKPIRLIPWLKEKIAKQYPGTKLSMTEYDFGGPKHVSSGIAQADLLGIFGREGMYMANYWGNGPGNGDLPPFVAAAFKLYRNYDGKGGKYGDTAATTTTPDPSKLSVYAATDSKKPGVLTMVVVNKSLRARFAGKLAIKGVGKYVACQAYVLDKSAPEVRAADKVDVKDNHLDYTLAPLSATLLVCEKR